MAQDWLTVKVSLVGGRGEVLSHPPGRVLLVSTDHTFRELAAAVDAAFARWDRSHLCMFVLPDGSAVTDAGTLDEIDMAGHDIDRTRVGQRVSRGTEFTYIFDLGDEWLHSCLVEQGGANPVETYGEVPAQPVAIDGWGDIPDQYGRRTQDEGDTT